MKYPYKSYLKYLVSKQFSNTEIREECLRLSMLSPDPSYIEELKVELGTVPRSWEPSYNKKNEYFCRWLRKAGVLPFWRQTPEVQEATRFLYRVSVRRDFETLTLSMGSILEIRKTLLMKYDSHLVPGEDVLENYCKFYWDLTELSSNEMVSFLSRYHNREANIACLQGDLNTAYAHSDIPQDIDAESFYNNFIAMAHQQISLVRKNSANEPLAGTAMMGIAALGRQAIEAIKSREEVRSSGRVEVLDTIREQAHAFQMRTIESNDIITIDDIIETEKEESKNGLKLAIVQQ